MMSVQDTSLEAYYSKVLPRIGYSQSQVLRIFKKFPSCNFTNMELAEELDWSINRVTPRVKELRDLGLLVKAVRRPCTVTRNNAYAWSLSRDWKKQ